MSKFSDITTDELEANITAIDQAVVELNRLLSVLMSNHSKASVSVDVHYNETVGSRYSTPWLEVRVTWDLN